MKTLFGLIISFPLLGIISLDTHYHFTNFDFISFFEKDARTSNYILNQLNKNQVEKVFLLSDAYRITKEYAQKQLLLGKDERVQLNQELSDEVSKQPDRLIGFCSINLEWDDYLDVFNKCKNLPGIKGIKLNPSWYNESLTSRDIFNKLKSIYELANKLDLIFLIHLKMLAMSTNSSLLEFDKIFELSKEFPRTTTIIAHLAQGKLLALKLLGDRMHAENVNNIYAEISTFFHNFLTPPDYLSSVMNDFGIDHILFGTDFPEYTAQKTLNMLQISGLSEEIINKITIENGEKFIQSHHLFK